MVVIDEGVIGRMYVVGVTLEMGARTRAAWDLVLDFLKQRGEEWSSLTELVEAGYLGSDLKPKSVQNIVFVMARVGVVERRSKKNKSGQGYRLNERVKVEIRLVATSRGD